MAGEIERSAARETLRASAYRAAFGIALAAALMLVWINGAVGIIGSEDNDANLMYGAVLGICVVGAIIARFHADSMARALVATALAQALVALVAVAGRMGTAADANWPLDILGVTALFVALWCTSAWLFRTAARQERPPASRAGPTAVE